MFGYTESREGLRYSRYVQEHCCITGEDWEMVVSLGWNCDETQVLEWMDVSLVWLFVQSMPVIESIISRLLYLPPRCSYYRNDIRFHGCYFEMYLNPYFISIAMMEWEGWFPVSEFDLDHQHVLPFSTVMRMQRIWVICICIKLCDDIKSRFFSVVS